MEEHFKYDAAFKRKIILCAENIGNRAAGRKYTVSEACVRHLQSIKTKLFSCLTNRRSFSGPKKGRNPETDASVLEYFKDLQNKELPVTNVKAEERARNSIPFKASCGWCEKFKKRESLSSQ
jgi:hypothetical protein